MKSLLHGYLSHGNESAKHGTVQDLVYGASYNNYISNTNEIYSSIFQNSILIVAINSQPIHLSFYSPILFVFDIKVYRCCTVVLKSKCCNQETFVSMCKIYEIINYRPQNICIFQLNWWRSCALSQLYNYRHAPLQPLHITLGLYQLEWLHNATVHTNTKPVDNRGIVLARLTGTVLAHTQTLYCHCYRTVSSQDSLISYTSVCNTRGRDPMLCCQCQAALWQDLLVA